MTDQDGKPWWQSRAIIGAGVAMLATAARLFAPDLDIDTDALTDMALDLATLIGSILAVWGRAKATQPIRRRTAAPGVRREPLPLNAHRPAAGVGAVDPADEGDEFAYPHGPFDEH